MDEAKLAGQGLPEWTVVHTRREGECAAHELAQLAKRTRHWGNMAVCGSLCRATYCLGLYSLSEYKKEFSSPRKKKRENGHTQKDHICNGNIYIKDDN